jgi:hypothetical protein
VTSQAQRRRIIERQGNACAWCHRIVQNLEVHHSTPRGMGGRHGEARKESESDLNKVAICPVCHSAADHQRMTLDGFNCRVCSWTKCEYRQT